VSTESVGATPLTRGTAGGAFARQATGLVRQAGAFDVFVYNTNFINIAIGVAFILLFVPAGAYPGANVYVAILFTVVAVLPTNLVYGMMASIMPRSGGDYVYVSRTLGPLWGLAANWNYTVWSFFYIGVPAAFLGKFGISSLMRTVGVSSGNLGLVNVGTFFASPVGTFLAGLVLIVVFTAIFITGLNTYMRVQNVLFVVAMLSLVAIVVVAAGASVGDYPARFNAYFAGVTGHGDTAKAIMDSLGRSAPAAAAFDLHDTVASMTWAFAVLGFGLASAYIGGEVKGASRAQLKGMVGSVLFSACWMLLLVAVVLRVIPYNLIGAIGAASPTGTGLGFTPVFTELVSVLTSNWFLLLLIGVGFCLWSYAWLPIYIITTTRNMLAWAFDGLLPVRVSAVDERFHSPVVAILLSSGLGIVFLGVYSFNTSFATISGFFGQVWTYMLAGIAAIVLPYRLRDVFEASPVRWRVGGVPLLSILGVLSLLGMGVIEYAYLNDPNSGISFRAPTMILVNVAVFLSGFVFYALTRIVRARQGIDVGLAFAEIPPE
jgi:amino acid transporter